MFIAMEFIEYGDLSNMKPEDQRSNARDITQQILEGLEVLHERNICHRDLKPQVCSRAQKQYVHLLGADNIEHTHRLAAANLGQDRGLRGFEILEGD